MVNIRSKLKNQLYKLLEIRNIIAILVTLLFIGLSAFGVLQVEFIQSIIMAVVIFFFAKGTNYDEVYKDEKEIRDDDIR